MIITKLELAAGGWAISCLGIVSFASATTAPAIYVSLAFSLLLITLLGVGYVLLGSIRKVGRANARSADRTLRLLKEAGVARESEHALLGSTIDRTSRTLFDILDMQNRADSKAISELQREIANIRQVETLVQEVRGLVLGSGNQLDEQGTNGVKLLEALTRQTVKIDLYMDEIRGARDHFLPSHKQAVLARITAE